MERSGRIVGREELDRAAWGRAYGSEDRSVDLYVAKLRVKLESAIPERRFIHTHFGFRYRFDLEPRAAVLPVA
jgi:DNA-binding response OmpR family regulator